MDKLAVNLFVKFEKRDDEQRIVEGFASTEALDSQREIVKSEAIVNALPDYMKFANIREMHQYSAVGKAISAEIDPVKKGLYIVAKVVDDVAWKKVKEGVYNGFSIGGRVLKRVGNTIHDMVLSEISLVDRPANPEALFSVVKMADSTEKCCDCGMPDCAEPVHQGIRCSSMLLSLANEVSWHIQEKQEAGLDVSHLEAVIAALKTAAVKEIEMDKVDKAAKDEEAEKLAQQLKEVKTIKSQIEQALRSKGVDQKWEDKYFEQHRTVV